MNSEIQAYIEFACLHLRNAIQLEQRLFGCGDFLANLEVCLLELENICVRMNARQDSKHRLLK